MDAVREAGGPFGKQVHDRDVWTFFLENLLVEKDVVLAVVSIGIPGDGAGAGIVDRGETDGENGNGEAPGAADVVPEVVKVDAWVAMGISGGVVEPDGEEDEVGSASIHLWTDPLEDVGGGIPVDAEDVGTALRVAKGDLLGEYLCPSPSSRVALSGNDGIAEDTEGHARAKFSKRLHLDFITAGDC